MSQDLIRKQHDLLPSADQWDTLQKISETVAGTDFVPRGLRNNKPAIMACLLYGKELGIGPMVSLQSIDVIDGSVSPNGALRAAIIRRAGHSVTSEPIYADAGQVVGMIVHGKRRDNGDEETVSFTIEDAKRAGLLNKQNWQKYPESMFWNRAVTSLSRRLFSDCFQGAVYNAEELGVEDTDEHGDIVDAVVSAQRYSTVEQELTASEPKQSLPEGVPVEAPSAATDGSEDTRKRTPEPRCACGHAAHSHREGPCKVQGCQCEEFRPSEPAGETDDPSGPGVPQTPEPVSPVPPNGEVADAILALVAKFDADGRMDKRKFDVALTSRYGRSDVHALEPWEQQELREKLETFDANTSRQL